MEKVRITYFINFIGLSINENGDKYEGLFINGERNDE